jgi:hypothetical protein
MWISRISPDDVTTTSMLWKAKLRLIEGGK